MKWLSSCFLMLLMSIILTAAGCPEKCTCLPGHGRMTCESNSVTRIPNSGDRNLTFLNLAYNRFTVPTLVRSNFTHLKDLVELTLTSCGIGAIQRNTFIDLTKLNLLDLSLNNLRAIDSRAFSGLHLDYLFLGDNPGIILPPSGFTDMSTRLINLNNCELSEVIASFFHPLIPDLRKLYISGNKIKRFSPNMKTIFQALDTLRIQKNPLICDCESRWLKIFYDDHNDIVEQRGDEGQNELRCTEPASLHGEFFNGLAVMDFQCEKPSLNTEIIFDKEKGILKCTSSGKPPPQLSWHRPGGVIEVTPPTDDPVNEAEIETVPTDTGVHGVYRCVATNEAGNASTTVNLTWPFMVWNNQVPCVTSESSTPKEIVIPNRNSDGNPTSAEEANADVFKRKYFTIIDIIIAVFGTFAGTLIITVLVLHICVYRKRKSSSQYSTPPQSEYSASSIKNDSAYPSSTQHSHVHTIPPHMQELQNRPLPNKPYHKAYDENHYMSTQLEDSDDLVRLGHHNAGALVSPHSPPCQACHTLNTQPRHSQAL